MAKTTRLHELLAVEGNLKAQADKTRADLMNTFEKKTHHFTEQTISFQPSEENKPVVVEKQLDLQTTVPQELKWASEFLIKSLDVSYQVAEANTVARADITLEGSDTPFLSQIPVTSLLELEKRANELQHFIATIPTLDPAKGFRVDAERGADIYRARDERKKRTKKIDKPLTLAAATKEHKEQVQLITVDEPIGDIVTLEWSGLITTAAKGDMLARVEEFARAVKQARSRANDTEVDSSAKQKIGAKIVNHVFGLQ